MDKFIETLLKKEDISIAFQNLFENALADEVRIINAIQAYLSNLLLFHLYIKIHGNYDAKEILGFPLPPQIAKQRASDSIKIDLNTYKKLYEVLLNAELKLKKMKDIDKNTFLLSSLIKLQKLL
jgi:DNA polymerase-3 subunit delta